MLEVIMVLIILVVFKYLFFVEYFVGMRYRSVY